MRSDAIHVFTTACGSNQRVMDNAINLIRSVYAGLARTGAGQRRLHMHLLHE